MIKYILFAIMLCLAMLGLAEFLHGLKIRFTEPSKRAVTYSVVFLSGDNPERQIILAAEQRLWLGGAYCDYIIAVNTADKDDNDAACRYIAEKYGIDYCTPKELNAKIGEYMPILTELGDEKI